MTVNWSRFEKEVERVNAYYRRKGIGTVEKIPNGSMTKYVNGVPRTVLTHKTGCDFVGHIKGVPVAFDCKSTSATSMPHKAGKADFVKKHQVKFLQDFKHSGNSKSLGFLLIRFNKSKATYFVDIDDYVEMRTSQLAKGIKSIPERMFAGMEVERQGTLLHYAKNIRSGQGAFQKETFKS